MSFVAKELVVLHVHSFGLTLDDGVIRNTNYSGVITLYGSFCLSPIHLNKGTTKLDHGFGTYEEARNLVFSSRGHDKLDNLGNSKDRAVYGRDRSVLREHDVGISADAGFADIEIGSI